jgi:hypothetical protein
MTSLSKEFRALQFPDRQGEFEAAVREGDLGKAAEEQALIVTIKLRSGGMSDAEERQRILALEDQLSAAIKESGAGEFDGDEFGEGVCKSYMYGPSAERLSSLARPILKKFRPPAGSYLIKRYGKPGSKQDRVAIGGDETAPR